jgi:hypothetical protein
MCGAAARFAEQGVRRDADRSFGERVEVSRKVRNHLKGVDWHVREKL